MKTLFTCFLSFLFISQSLVSAELDKLSDKEDPSPCTVNVVIKRDKDFYGGMAKWSVSQVNAEIYRQLDEATASRYLKSNRIGKIKQKEFVEITIPANEETLIYVGSQYFYINASPSSEITIYLKGTDYGLDLCNGEANIGAGFKSPNTSLYFDDYEEFVVQNMANCGQIVADLHGYSEKVFTQEQ